MDDSIEPLLENTTASIGYVGLNEASYVLSGFGLAEDTSVAHDILDALNRYKNEAIKKYGRMFAVYGTPAENLVGRFQRINREKYGIIPHVTDSEYMTNSYHIHVKDKVNPFEKIEIESSLFHKSNGGHIVYTEMAQNINTKAQELVVLEAMKQGLYFGVNFVTTSCMSCGENGLLEDAEVCTRCGSDSLFQAVRICGYLSANKIHGKSRASDHKRVEIEERYKHSNH